MAWNQAFVIYKSSVEIIVCNLDAESEVIAEYFVKYGRNLDDYDREVKQDIAVSITSQFVL